jgi:hypothetical protein
MTKNLTRRFPFKTFEACLYSVTRYLNFGYSRDAFRTASVFSAGLEIAQQYFHLIVAFVFHLPKIDLNERFKVRSFSLTFSISKWTKTKIRSPWQFACDHFFRMSEAFPTLKI